MRQARGTLQLQEHGPIQVRKPVMGEERHRHLPSANPPQRDSSWWLGAQVGYFFDTSKDEHPERAATGAT
ncbi:hypothetical protein [Xanthomonas campestris]|uniref:hypothetical protein n=1 Tax=Xanthomonas TaxID=338 RepID=UPI001E33C312|nr:hypothetical protein [Xanthomonas campestris]